MNGQSYIKLQNVTLSRFFAVDRRIRWAVNRLRSLAGCCALGGVCRLWRRLFGAPALALVGGQLPGSGGRSLGEPMLIGQIRVAVPGSLGNSPRRVFDAGRLCSFFRLADRSFLTDFVVLATPCLRAGLKTLAGRLPTLGGNRPALWVSVNRNRFPRCCWVPRPEPPRPCGRNSNFAV